MLRCRIVPNERGRPTDDFSRREEIQLSGGVQGSTLRQLRGDYVSCFDVRGAPNYNYLKLVGELHGELRIKWPSLRSPRAARGENDESGMNSSIGEELVCDSTVILSRIQTRFDLLGKRWIRAIAEREGPQAFGVMPVGAIRNSLGVKRSAR